MKSITYPLGLPADLYREIQRAAKETDLSTADAIRQSIKLGLPSLRERLSTAGRVTNVEPLPDKIARRLYAEREDDAESIRQFMRAQATVVEE